MAPAAGSTRRGWRPRCGGALTLGPTGRTQPNAAPAADCLQRPLRFRFRQRLRRSVRLQKRFENLCPSREVHMERRLSAILAADIAGYSRLMGEDEDGTVQALQGHQEEVLPLVATFGGRIIDTAGDGILAEFPSVIAAVECAADIQVTMAR